MTSYNIMLNECVVGIAEIETEGLYLTIKAQCSPPDMQIYKLILMCGSKRTDLGICVPEDDFFSINKRIQRKLIGEGTLRFFLEIREDQRSTQFVQINSEGPFDYLDCLPSARFEKRGEACGVVF